MRVVVLFLLASIGAVAWSQDLVPRGELFGPFEMVRVVDGERFIIDLPDFDETVRLIGLDVRGQDDAAMTLGRLLSGRGIWLELVEPARDMAGNLQGYAYVLDGQGRWAYNGQRFSQVNRLLGGQGYAGLATSTQNVFRPTSTTSSVRVPPAAATIDVSGIGMRAPPPLSFDEARLRRVGAPQRQGRLDVRLLADTPTMMSPMSPVSPTTSTTTTPGTRRITTTVTTTTTTTGSTTGGTGSTRVITSTARSCQDFASWEDAQAFVSQLPLAQQGAFDEDGDGVFCEELLLERRCDSFASWQDAQAFFETLAPTSASARQLDGDGDGVACETLLVGSAPNTSITPNNISVNVTADTPSTMNASSSSVITDLSVAPTAPTESARHASNCIDLNQASLSELSHLAGVTLFRADQIVRNRPYALVSDLARLPGFSAQLIANVNAQGLACVR